MREFSSSDLTMSNRMINVQIENDRWALKVLYNPNETCSSSSSSSSSTIIQTIPSSRHQRPQTIIEINSLQSNQSLFIIREHLSQTTRASILPLERIFFAPILTADIIGESVNDDRSLMIKDGQFCSICFNLYEQSDELLQLSCQHVYHRQCLMQWLQTHYRCPYCRFVVYQQTVTPHLFLFR